MYILCYIFFCFIGACLLVVFHLVSSVPSQVTGWEERLKNNLFMHLVTLACMCGIHLLALLFFADFSAIVML